MKEETTRHLLYCFLWVIKHLDRAVLKLWWSEMSHSRLQTLLEILRITISCFQYRVSPFLSLPNTRTKPKMKPTKKKKRSKMRRRGSTLTSHFNSSEPNLWLHGLRSSLNVSPVMGMPRSPSDHFPPNLHSPESHAPPTPEFAVLQVRVDGDDGRSHPPFFGGFP